MQESRTGRHHVRSVSGSTRSVHGPQQWAAAAVDVCQALPGIPGSEDGGPGPVVSQASNVAARRSPPPATLGRRSCSGGIVMAIDFTLTPQQKEIQETARDFAENIL